MTNRNGRPIEEALGRLGEKSDHDLMVMTAQNVLVMQHTTLPSIIERLDHTNGGFRDHEERIQAVEDCIKDKASLEQAETAKREADMQRAVKENNMLQARLIKRLTPWVVIVVLLGNLIGAILVPFFKNLGV
jgi:hypothetical protein